MKSSVNHTLEPLRRQLRFFTYWSTRTWFEVVWATAVLAIVIVLEIGIARSEDAFGLNGGLEVGTFLAGLAAFAVGLFVIWLIAQFVEWLRFRRNRRHGSK